MTETDFTPSNQNEFHLIAGAEEKLILIVLAGLFCFLMQQMYK